MVGWIAGMGIKILLRYCQQIMAIKMLSVSTFPMQTTAKEVLLASVTSCRFRIVLSIYCALKKVSQRNILEKCVHRYVDSARNALILFVQYFSGNIGRNSSEMRYEDPLFYCTHAHIE